MKVDSNKSLVLETLFTISLLIMANVAMGVVISTTTTSVEEVVVVD